MKISFYGATKSVAGSCFYRSGSLIDKPGNKGKANSSRVGIFYQLH